VRLRWIAALLAALAAGVQLALASASPKATLEQGIVDVNTSLGYSRSAAAGTGMVLTPNGEVLTNNHVIRGATTIRVYVPATHRTYSAKVVGYSVSSDVAVLQLQHASGLQTVELGDSAKLKRGQAVTAVGNAGGVGGTPSSTQGMITGLGRSITARDEAGSSERLTGLIETDAGLQPGDSGGPLLDTAGRVIGMDTAASSGFAFQSGGGGSDGYAIPINRALALAKQIVAGRASVSVHIGATPFLGISIQLPRFDSFTSGLFVANVYPSSPADRAGVSAGDTILTLDGRAVDSQGSLTSRLLRKAPGATVKLGLIDQLGNRSTRTVTLGSGPPQ
jgi:S1-C subfamily serine protease